MLEFRIIPNTFDGTAMLFKMYAGQTDLLQPVEKVKDNLIKEIPSEDVELVEYLKSGKEPELIDLCSF